MAQIGVNPRNLISPAGQQRFGSGIAGGGGAAGGTVIPNGPTQQQQIGPAQWSFTLVLDADDTPQVVPGLIVAKGQSIWLYAKNGQSAGNTDPLFIADNPASLINTPNAHALCLMPGDVVPYPAPSTGRIWVSGSAADGVVIQVATSPTAS